MGTLRRFVERLLNLLRLRRPDRAETDLAREIDAHLALLQEGYEARGMAPDAARRAARLAFGSVDLVREQHLDARSFRWLEEARRDASHGLRLLRRSPVFTATAVLSIAVGVGANTAVFTVANGLVFRPPTGVASPSTLILFGAARGDGGLNPVSYSTWLEASLRATTLTAVSAEGLRPRVMGLVTPETPGAEAVLGQGVTPGFFRTLGTRPFRGRTLREGDDSAAVLSHDYWIRRFHGAGSAVGRTVQINGRPVRIVGVLAPDFRGTGLQGCDLWVVIRPGAAGVVVGVGRLRKGASVAESAAELGTIGTTIGRATSVAAENAPRLDALPLTRAGENRNLVFWLSGAVMALVSLVLAAACANVAGIMLTRATARAREMALRAALGAGRGRLFRQLLTETIVVFLLGGLLGVGLAQALVRLAMLTLPPLPTSLLVPLAIDWRVLLFALLLSFLSAVVFGVLPAVRGTRVEAGTALKDGMRSSAGRTRLRGAFVVAQVACGVLLVVTSVLFLRVLRYAGAADRGFEARGVDVATLDLSTMGDPVPPRQDFWQTVIDRIRRTRGVEDASLARVPPGGFEGIGLGGVAVADQAEAPPEVAPGWNIVDTGYFATLRIPLIAGRDFTATDRAESPPVVIISETLARRLWPGRAALGRPLRLAPRGSTFLATVVGVVGDIRSSSLVDGLADPYVYLPLAQSAEMAGPDMTTQMSVVARRGGGAGLAAAMATVLHGIDARLVLTHAEPLADAIALGLTPQRVLASIGGAMALIALLLASMGIYGVTAYAVELRRRELAIRLALGAPRSRVVRMVIWQGAWLVSGGLGLGFALARGVGQVLSIFLYGLPATNPGTLTATAALFVVVGVLAAAVPAGQAVRDGWRQALQEE